MSLVQYRDHHSRQSEKERHQNNHKGQRNRHAIAARGIGMEVCVCTVDTVHTAREECRKGYKKWKLYWLRHGGRYAGTPISNRHKHLQ